MPALSSDYLNVVVFKVHKNSLRVIHALRVVYLRIRVHPVEAGRVLADRAQRSVHLEVVPQKRERHVHLVALLQARDAELLIDDAVDW